MTFQEFKEKMEQHTGPLSEDDKARYRAWLDFHLMMDKLLCIDFNWNEV
jgi:hypothetical protein